METLDDLKPDAATTARSASQAATAFSSSGGAPLRLRPSRKLAPVLVVFTLVALLVGSGVVVATSMLTRPNDSSLGITGDGSGVVDGAGPFAVGNSVRTSFGVVAVQYVYAITNVPANGGTPIEVGLAFSNLGTQTAALSPSQIDIVANGDGQAIPILLSAPHVEIDSLAPGVSRNGGVRFIVPAHASKLELRFHDAGGAKHTIVIELGGVDTLRKQAIEGGK